MPFLKEIIINEKTKIKLWKVTLGEIDDSNLDDYDRNLIELKKSHLSKEQFLAIRKLIELENLNYKIRYNKFGKPSINSTLNISISHSKEIAAIVFSNNKIIGLDIQKKEKKILKIQNKFLNKSEILNIGVDPNVDILTMIWTSKESIFKAMGLKGISFSENIIIVKVIEKEKYAVGYYINGNKKIKFNLNFFYLGKYFICYAFEG
ncbi:4'-phosphopantetheinyl transferase superfamily protein [Flavobacteriaceae bacterium]|nr:4'-phosphopantetheinyl transferase superfamily protein [Flavobacteriaceae bacterium]